MSVPYLNRGESIVLTTHRVSIGSVLYDAMLTNQRIILIDSRYDRFEPEMIPFIEIVTVKGGKASTGEPAIILTLKEPNDFTDSGQASLIFTQNPNEKRKHDRELWVKKLIELVIKAREQEAQSGIVPSGKKTGLQPSVRRWEAPEPVRPHSSATEPAPPAPEPVVITEQEPDSLEFFLEEKVSKEKVGGQTFTGEKRGAVPAPVAVSETDHTEPLAPNDIPEEAEPVQSETLPEPEDVSREETVPKDPFAGIHISPPQPEPAVEHVSSLPEPVPTEVPVSRGNFSSIIKAAAESLQARKDDEAPPEPEVPPVAEMEKPIPPRKDGILEPENLSVKEQAVKRTSPLPERRPDENNTILPVHTTPGEKRELPGTYTPEIPVPVITTSPHEKKPVTRATSKKIPVAITAILVFIVMIALISGIVIAMNYLQSSAYSNTVVTIVPSTTNMQDNTSVPADQQQTGVRVHVIYPNLFTGTIGSPGHLQQVSGTGNKSFAILMTTSIVQATIQKPDNSGEALTVEIFDNGTLLASRTVTAPMSEINLLIDTKTATPPGMGHEPPSSDNKTLLGNGSLIYY